MSYTLLIPKQEMLSVFILYRFNKNNASVVTLQGVLRAVSLTLYEKQLTYLKKCKQRTHNIKKLSKNFLNCFNCVHVLFWLIVVKLSKAVYGFASFRLICFQIQKILYNFLYKKAILNVQWVSQVKILNQKLCSYFKISS